jgi:hypothetical protein
MARAAHRPARLRSTVVVLAALGLLATASPTVLADEPAATAATATEAATRQAAPQVTALSAELEQLRAEQAVELYGDPAIRPLNERQVSLASLGDSEISGEGVGNYESPTDGPSNWCHRSHDAAIHRTSIPADVTYNFACSGASSQNIRIGGTPQYADELVQSDSLAIAARNTRVDTIVLVAGANDDLQFGPVITDCVMRWFLFWQGACNPVYNPGWQARVDGLRPKVEATITDLHTVMSQAGYAREDYQLVVLGYPGPLSPDVYDNPDFPGKIPGGCTGYDSDAAWGRDVAVPLFQQGIRAAAHNAGATYLDASRLLHGHEVCTDLTWARGLYVEITNPFPPDENSVRQSFHPNYRGHGAFASCLSQLHASGLTEASCADPASTGAPVLFAGAWDDHFAPLVNAATGECADASGSSSRNGTAVNGWDCHGERNQGWWHDPQRGSLHVELSHDRCLDVPSGNYTAGTPLQLFDCHGGANQRFTRAGDTISPTQAPSLCVTQPGSRQRLTLRPCDGSAQQRFL